MLTPLTVFRIHPFDGLIFANILAVSLGVTNGVANYLFGKPITFFSIDDTNIILVLFVHIYVHLQHTHLWIAFTGLAGAFSCRRRTTRSITPTIRSTSTRISAAAWRSGTGCSARSMCRRRQPEPLSFGVKVGEADMHSLSELSIAPVQRAAATSRRNYAAGASHSARFLKTRVNALSFLKTR